MAYQEIVIYVIIAFFAFFIFASVTDLAADSTEQQIVDNQCAVFIEQHIHKRAVGEQSKFLQLAIEIAEGDVDFPCYTRQIDLVSDKTENQARFAEEAERCWHLFKRGKPDVFAPQEGNHCFICSAFNTDKEQVTLEAPLAYMSKVRSSYDKKTSVLNYLYGETIETNIIASLDTNLQSLEDDPLLITYVSSKNTGSFFEDLRLQALTGAGGGIAAAGLLLAVSPVGLSTIAILGIGAAAGGIIGAGGSYSDYEHIPTNTLVFTNRNELVNHCDILISNYEKEE